MCSTNNAENHFYAKYIFKFILAEKENKFFLKETIPRQKYFVLTYSND